MKLFRFGRKRASDRLEAIVEDLPDSPALWLVVIQWYDTGNVTSEAVSASSALEALRLISCRYKKMRRNHDYGVMNIVGL